MTEARRWRYERGEGRTKHRWQHDYAGFVPAERGACGKCASSINQELAEQLLNEGVPFAEMGDHDWPSRIYAVYQGAIYEAVPTIPGTSYHGYPRRGDLPGRTPLPRAILRKLEAKALERNEANELKQWLKQYGGR